MFKVRILATLFTLTWPWPTLGLAQVTFTRDVAPILYKHCAACHRPGEVGPFALLTYKDASRRAQFLKEITASRRMPPWKAELQEHRFLEERRLSDAEIATLARWADTGAKEGDPKDLPPMPKFTEGWQLGQPDMVVKMRQPFTVPATGRDIYQWFTLPLNLTGDKTVAAVEFRPGNRRVVHHVLMYLDNTGAGRQKDPEGKGWLGFGGPGFLPSGGLGVWVPGLTPRLLPEGLGMVLPKNSDLVFQLHYHPSGKEEQDQSTIGIYFTKKPADKLVAGLAALNTRLSIPPGEKRHQITAQTAPLPVDVLATGIFPHMHLIGREFLATAHQPDGKTYPLIHIKDWDFNWQNVYFYEKPIPLPKGTVVKVEAYYDNTADNPQNPNTPPKQVRWGEQTTDEMCVLAVQVITQNQDDLRQIIRQPNNRLGAALVGGVVSLGTSPLVLPAGGFPIPEAYVPLMRRFDTNNDGKLSREEIEAMPPALRERVIEYIRVQGRD
jgi:mono/diheme cytochrome c family protein